MSPPSRKQIVGRYRADRRGQSLILVFFALIVLIGIMALTLDYGFVLLARRQMQTGVNAAALEGLRSINNDGRQNAADLIRNVYDDNLDATFNDTTIGAGIDKSLIQGDGFRSVTIGNGNGVSSTLANRSQLVFRPNPELNNDNLQHGDFVQGDYVDTSGHEESSVYQRDDFTAGGTGSENAFLARLRRTHNPTGLDQVPGVSSSGGGLPLIVGHLAWFGATDPAASYSIRRDGVTVRATAIAQEQIAVRVFPSTDARIYGALPYAIQGGELSAGNLATQLIETGVAHESVGELVNSLGSASLPTVPGYIAIYEQISSVDHVVGFYLHSPSGPALQPNVSPRLQDAWDVFGALSEADRVAIRDFQDNPTLRSLLVKAPSLVRSVR